VFVEAILDEEQTATGDQALPMYLQMIDRELSPRVLAGVLAGVEDDRAGGALLCDVEALPLHLALTPPQMLGQVEVLSPVEMVEFQKDFAKYDDVTQMADFDRLHGLHPTSTRCTESETCYSCGISIADFCEGADDENLG
jgi:hypothetical protein